MHHSLRSIPYQPFLIAIFIGVSIYTPNRLYFPVNTMILPMIILFCLIGIALAVFKYIQWDLNKGQIFISFTLILNFTYYSFYDSLAGKWLNHAISTFIYIALWILLIVITLKLSRSKAANLSRFMDLIAAILLLIGLANFGFYAISDAKEINSDMKDSQFESRFQRYLAEDLTAPNNNRDFYFIILDRYPGADTLNAEYEFNNSDFIKNLTSMGFIVPRESKSNYAGTDSSIPSMVNMDYYDTAIKDGYDIVNFRLWKFFKSQGFKFVYLPSIWITTYKNENADIILNPYIHSINPSYPIFQKIMFFERTLLGKIYYVLLTKNEVSIKSWQYPDQYIRTAGNEGLGRLLGVSDNSSRDRQDSTFKMVAGLADRRYASFESVNYAGYYLYCLDNRVTLQKIPSDPDQLFKANATFKVLNGLADVNAVSIESYNFPGQYIRARNSWLYIENGSDGPFKNDATFRIASPNNKWDTLDSAADLQERIRARVEAESDEERVQADRRYTRNFTLDTFKNLTQVPKIRGKKFTFAHILGWENIYDGTITNGSEYVDRIKVTNMIVEPMVKEILEESDPDPVIVVLSDHGKKPSLDAINRNRSTFAKYACYQNKSLDQDSVDAASYTINNFEAFYLPDGGDEILYPDITPINEWRMILNFYFGTDFQRTDDRSYWYSRETGICEVPHLK